MMHVFEALVTLFEITGDQSLLQDIDAQARFVTEALYRRPGDGPGTVTDFIPAEYNASYVPLPIAADHPGGKLPVGHQFEWAYWLSRATDSGALQPVEHWKAVAWRLLQTGLEVGYDEAEG